MPCNYLQISDYGKAVRFNDIKTVLIRKGDSSSYKDPEYNDKAWGLISVPSKWNETSFPGWNGICWYRIHIKFPAEMPPNSIGISLGRIFDVDETYFNGGLIGENGSFAPGALNHAYDKNRIYEIPSSLIRPGKDNVISVRVKNYFPLKSGMVAGDYIIDKYDDLLKNYYVGEFIKASFVIFYFTVSCYFLLFYFRRKKAAENLIFGLFCMLFGLYFFLRTGIKYLITGDFMLLQKAEYGILFTLFPLFTQFIIMHFRKKNHFLQYVFYSISLAGLIFILSTNEPVLWDFINTDIIQPSWLISIGTISVILIREFKKQHQVRIMLLSFIILIFAVVYDVFISRYMITAPLINKIGFFSPYGFLLFIGSIAFILSGDLVQLYKENEIKTINLELTLKERDEAYRQIDEAYAEALFRLAHMAELRDEETGTHIKRVGIYIRVLAEKAGFDSNFTNLVSYAAPMHDAGKVGIPDHILFKKGALNAEEWEFMKTHTTIGGKIFEGAKSAVLKLAREIALTHHEKWDGSGYPGGLRGNIIPVSGRLMAMVDVYDALRSLRPYKPEMPNDRVIELIKNGDSRIKPGDFDPVILNTFIRNAGLFNEIYLANKDLEQDLELKKQLDRNLES